MTAAELERRFHGLGGQIAIALLGRMIRRLVPLLLPDLPLDSDLLKSIERAVKIADQLASGKPISAGGEVPKEARTMITTESMARAWSRAGQLEGDLRLLRTAAERIRELAGLVPGQSDRVVPAITAVIYAAVALLEFEYKHVAFASGKSGQQPGPFWHQNRREAPQQAWRQVASVVAGTAFEAKFYAAVARDIELVEQLVSERALGPAQNLPSAILGPLWPNDPPSGWPDELVQVADQRLILKFVVPPMRDTRENREVLKARIRNLILRANAVHLASGGSGLRIDDAKLYVASQAPAVAGGGE